MPRLNANAVNRIVRQAELLINDQSSQHFGTDRIPQVCNALNALNEHHANAPKHPTQGCTYFEPGEWEPYAQREYELSAALFGAIIGDSRFALEQMKDMAALPNSAADRGRDDMKKLVQSQLGKKQNGPKQVTSIGQGYSPAMTRFIESQAARMPGAKK